MTSTTFDLLQKQREALTKAMRVALVVERLNRCLESMLIAKNPGGYLPQQAVRYYEALNRQAHSISTSMLKEYIDKLEERVTVDFKLILEITRIAGDPSAQGAALVGVEDIDSFVAEFSAHSQKLVGLRVLLHKRGEQSPGLKLEIPTQSLQKRAKQIAELESCYRHKVRHDIVQLQQDTLNLFDSPGLEEGMRSVLQQTFDDLQTALDHIDGGGDLSDIPVKVQTIQLDSSPLSGEVFCAQIVDLGEAEEPAVTNDEPPVPQEQQGKVSPRSFWQSLKIWINTPFRVSWRDIRQGKR